MGDFDEIIFGFVSLMVLSRVGRRAPAEGRVVESWRDFDETIVYFFSADGIVTGRKTRASGDEKALNRCRRKHFGLLD